MLEYCKHYHEQPETCAKAVAGSCANNTEMDEWDRRFLNVDQEMLFDLILAANHLSITPLL